MLVLLKIYWACWHFVKLFIYTTISLKVFILKITFFIMSYVNEISFQNVEVNKALLKDFAIISKTFKCKICSYTSDCEKIFYSHCLKHFQTIKNQISVYLCSECYQSFNSLEETKAHMGEVHKKANVSENSSQSINIQIKRANDEDNKKPKQKAKEEIKHNCAVKSCKVSFENEEHLEIHIKCHLETESKIFCCPFCTALFPSWTPCAFHLFRSHAIECGLLKCPFCELYRTSKHLALQNHMRVHSDLRSFLCKTCGKTFKQASQLRNHNNNTHASDSDSILRKKWKQCTMCFKMYADAKSLKKHKEEVHNKLRPFVCNVCGHASARKALLVLHQRQHTGHKTHKCNICAYKTADYNCLRNHLMRHTGVRPYRCTDCSFSSIKSTNLKVHVKKMHPGSLLYFSCSRCSYKTVSEDNYIRHVSDHLTGLIKTVEIEGVETGSDQKAKEFERKFPAWVPVDAE